MGVRKLGALVWMTMSPDLNMPLGSRGVAAICKSVLRLDWITFAAYTLLQLISISKLRGSHSHDHRVCASHLLFTHCVIAADEKWVQMAMVKRAASGLRGEAPEDMRGEAPEDMRGEAATDMKNKVALP